MTFRVLATVVSISKIDLVHVLTVTLNNESEGGGEEADKLVWRIWKEFKSELRKGAIILIIHI